MNPATSAPSSFREISEKLFNELLALLCQGRHLALIAPRQSGKALVLYELRSRSRLLPEADRPEVVVLWSFGFRGDSRAGFVERLAGHLGIATSSVVRCAGQSLAAEVLELLRSAVVRRRTPLWLFVQSITELAWPLARALLTALQSASEDSEFRGRFAVVITGGQDFAPLTFDANSPYRHAEKFFLQGFDREMTRRVFRARIAGVSLNDGLAEIPSPYATPPIDADALDFLFEQTGGYSRFIEEIVLTAGRLAPLATTVEAFHRSSPWTRQRVEELMTRFQKEHMRFDQYCRLSLREVERNAEAWTKLEQLANDPQGGVRISEVQPHLLETSGIARRKDGTTLVFASPMWGRFLKARLNQQYHADVYARLGKWDLAWNLYTDLNAADCDRPLDGDERYRLDSVIDAWEDYLVEVTTQGSPEVARQFLLGARHLYGCSAGVLFDQTSRRVIQAFKTDQPARAGLFVDDASILIPDDKIELRLTPTRDAIESAPKAKAQVEHSGLDPVLQLRRAPEREIDTPTLKRLRRSLRRFWLAYLTAVRVELAALRERHLQVVAKVNDLLSHYPGDMGKVVEGTVDALIDIAGYYRILICLVSPSGDRIQAVAGRCADPHYDFNFRTDFPLDRDSSERDWDINQWVAIKGETVAVDDASAVEQHSPRTNSRHVVAIEMRGIAVVPIKVVGAEGYSEEILGTIHFERQDKRRPTEVELRSFEILASQIAVAFDHARRQTMLEQALNALKSEFRIVSPDHRIVFENLTAAEADGRNSHLWTDQKSNRPDQPGGERFDRDVILDAARMQVGVHRYVTTSNNPSRAFDDFAAPIRDWRTKLDGVFKSDGMLGFVYQSYELSDFVRIHEASQQWLSLNSLRETAQRILDYFRKQQFQWCRIYLFENEERLASFEEFGISDPVVRQDFLDGNFFVECSDPGQQAFFLLHHFRDLAVLRFDEAISGSPIPDTAFGRGIPTFRTNDNWRQEFQKTDEKWLEAPLIVGGETIGLIALATPEQFSPQSYQMLRWSVLNVAVALHLAREAERRIRLELAGAKEEAWQSAAQLAIHQLANKLSPVESECHYVQSWLRSHSLEATSGYRDVDDALSNSQKSIAFARGILMDFRRYATDEPFKDICDCRVGDLLQSIRDHLGTACPPMNLTVEPVLHNRLVRCSRSALLEVFEALALNSLAHSGKCASDLRVSITVESVAHPGGSAVPPGEEVRLVYRDNGRGISDRDRPRIFDAFFTTNQKGNGLGLAIAQRFLHRQGGHITEEGTVGFGATFCVYLPTGEATIHGDGP